MKGLKTILFLVVSNTFMTFAWSLLVFMSFTLLFFKNEHLRCNHLAGFGLIVLAVFVIFKKW